MINRIISDKTGCNTYLIEEDGYVIIIDPGQGPGLMAEIRDKGYKPEYILLTHEHYDHIENLEEVRNTYKVPVISSYLCSERIQNVRTNLSNISSLLQYFKTGKVPKVENERFTCGGADIVFDEEYVLNWRGHSFTFKRVPGHSPGSVLITMDEGIIFTGDYLIYRKEEILRLKGGSEKDFREVTEPLLEALPPDARLYPGHGPSYIKGMEEMPYSLTREDKESLLMWEMKELTMHHRKGCEAYDRICEGLGDIEGGPMLPVTIFKSLDLMSVPQEEILRKVTSSGTSGQQVSQIFLDGETAAAQQRALCMITGDFIGNRRIPMLIIDSPNVLRDRTKFSARGAGIMGFSMMASKRYYALTDDMEIDLDSIREFAELAKKGPSFAFGFTYIIWSCFAEGLRKLAIANQGLDDEECLSHNPNHIDLSGCHLIHGGGWKKLAHSRVSDEEFRRTLKELCNFKSISDYYGMAEQTGSIYMQCEEGHLHASNYSDIRIINPEDFSECTAGETGLIALDSVLPKSYPGHRILTEDLGMILGEDDCPCGRRGKYFKVLGRIEKVEIRGCSDTFEGKDADVVATSNGAGGSSSMPTLIGGCYPVEDKPAAAFDKLILEFIDQLSTLFMREQRYRQIPEIYSLGFWCRRAHIESIRSRYEDEKAGEVNLRGKGLTLHIAPSNMPTMFAYSWITSLLAGNPNVVRFSSREIGEASDSKGGGISRILLRGICEILERPEFAELKKRNAFVSFPRNSEHLEEISAKSSARIIWGGDETINSITAVSKAEGCVDLTFPDKYSIALFDLDYVGSLRDDELKHLAHLFYNDTYVADQNACSSPRTVFWLNTKRAAVEEEKIEKIEEGRLEKSHKFRGDMVKQRWWDAVAEEAKAYDLQPYMATEKYRMLCCAYADKAHPDKSLKPVKMWGNRLYVIPVEITGGDGAPYYSLSSCEAKLGMFYECDIDHISELYALMDEKIQTITVSGMDPEEITEGIRRAGCTGVDRVVFTGEALNFDPLWDRKDMIRLLTEQVK